METDPMNDRPLLDRLTPASHRALLLWCVSYALNHRDEITPDDVEALRRGNKAQQKTAELLTRYGLDLRRPAL
jgi:hypothetical protein